MLTGFFWWEMDSVFYLVLCANNKIGVRATPPEKSFIVAIDFPFLFFEI
jgi:hypothetical protein